MGKIINVWLKKPMFVYTFGLFFLIFNTVKFFPSFQLFLFLGVFGCYLLCNYVIIIFLKKFNVYRFGLSGLLLFWILIFFTAPILAFVQEYVGVNLSRFRYIALLFLFFYLLIARVKKNMDENSVRSVNHLLNVFVFIFIGITILNGLITWQHEKKHLVSLQKEKSGSFTIKNNKDIVWLLLDEYASPASLKSQFNFKDPLKDSLSRKGFLVFNSLQSRSSTTIYSINSLFNLDDSIPVSNYMYAADYLKKSSWIKQLSNIGYEFISLDFLNIAYQPKSYELSIFPDNYLDQLFSGSLYSAVLDRYVKRNMLFNQYNEKTLLSIAKITQEKQSRPTFIWAHLLIPHPPFYKDAQGKLINSSFEDGGSDPELVRKQYVDYLSYGNHVILDVLSKIPDWRRKIIIISGDHGARMLLQVGDPRRTETFGAIYYPGMDIKELSKIKYMQQIPFHLH